MPINAEKTQNIFYDNIDKTEAAELRDLKTETKELQDNKIKQFKKILNDQNSTWSLGDKLFFDNEVSYLVNLSSNEGNYKILISADGFTVNTENGQIVGYLQNSKSSDKIIKEIVEKKEITIEIINALKSTLKNIK